jgi:hypothetical protein
MEGYIAMDELALLATGDSFMADFLAAYSHTYNKDLKERGAFIGLSGHTSPSDDFDPFMVQLVDAGMISENKFQLSIDAISEDRELTFGPLDPLVDLADCVLEEYDVHYYDNQMAPGYASALLGMMMDSSFYTVSENLLWFDRALDVNRVSLDIPPDMFSDLLAIFTANG